MCGICGQFKFEKGATVSPALIHAMAGAIRHRGPDDDGFYVSGQIGLGFRRLAIIDLTRGHQPISNEDETVWLVFNGEIYNYRALREDLMSRGHIFKTQSDTEVIVHAYEEYGTECVQRLRGMFAFAIWDARNEQIVLARDRVGIKPLYYYLASDSLSFGSELKAILVDPSVPRDVDPTMIDRALTYHYLPGKQTLLKNVLKLEPGHTLVVKNGRPTLRRYWDLAFSEYSKQRSERDLEDELLKVLDDAVALHMISDVPIGFLLSCGVDSTALLSLAAQRISKPIRTFTIGFSGRGVVDERPYARIAAERFGATHYELSISPTEFADFLPRYVWHMEEPVCEPPAIALYYISKLAGEYVKVLISGEGGDEAFAGYENYRNILWFENIKAAVGPLQRPAAIGATVLGRMLNSRVLLKYGPRLGVPFNEYYLSRAASPFEFFPRERANLYSPQMASEVDVDRSAAVTRQYLSSATGYSVLNKMLYVDTNTWLPDELLLKADKMTMANSVELRVPLLDHKVLEFAATMPKRAKIRGFTTKYAQKRTLRDRVPREILERPKAGFPVPYRAWLRGELREQMSQILLDPKTLSRGYFRAGALEALWKANGKGMDLSKEVFSMAVIELWHREFVDRKPTGRLTETGQR
jgi:asparagine synthase (glutamine-hydrolysing)